MGYTLTDEFPKSGKFVIGGFCVRILQKDTIEQARRFANAVGALTATKKGAQPSLLTKAEVDELMATK